MTDGGQKGQTEANLFSGVQMHRGLDILMGGLYKCCFNDVGYISWCSGWILLGF